MSKSIVFAFTGLVVAALLVACGAGPTSGSGMPPAPAGTLLRKIQDRGRLIVGIKYDVPTFGFRNPQTGNIEGFDASIAHEIANYIFGDPSKIEFKEAVTANRIPYLKDGTVDIVLATFTITEDRMKEIDFSVVYYVSGDKLLVAQDSTIKGIQDLNGKKVAINKGSTTQVLLAKSTSAVLVEVGSTADALNLVKNRQVDAMTGDDVSLLGTALMNSGFKVVGAPMNTAPLGAGIAKNSPELLSAVNTVIKNLKSSGKWKTIWKTEIGDKFGMVSVPEPPGDDWKVSN
jgi:aspartate/glutamate/glutamine transport system substrate-binding protein